MGPSGCIGYILHILDCLGKVNAGFIQVLYLGRALRTKETLLDFREKCRVTGHSRVFRGLTGSQRTPGIWGVTNWIINSKPNILKKSFNPNTFLCCNSGCHIFSFGA